MFQPEAKEHVSAKRPDLNGMSLAEAPVDALVQEDASTCVLFL